MSSKDLPTTSHDILQWDEAEVIDDLDGIIKYQDGDNDDNDSNDDDDGEEVTAQQVLQLLETAWTNEMCSPDLLPHQSDMLELMLGQISHMEENMRELDKNDFRCIIHKMELERIRYIIASYLRCRLQKIELFTKHILDEEAGRLASEKILSPEETRFARDYHENVEQHFHQMALQYMPNVHRSEINQRIVRPNLMSHVFIKASENVPSLVIGVDGEEVDITSGSQHIIPYQLVSELIKKNQVQLI